MNTFQLQFDTVQIRHFRASTLLSCPDCRDSIKSSISWKLNNKAQCSQASFYFKFKRSILTERIPTTTQALSLHVPLNIFCFFSKNQGCDRHTQQQGDRIAKVWSKRPWLSDFVVVPSNSSSNRTENKPVNSHLQNCSNSLILLGPDGHLKPFAQISAIP